MLEGAGLGKTPAMLGGALIAGFFASACSLPFDYVRGRGEVMLVVVVCVARRGHLRYFRV